MLIDHMKNAVKIVFAIVALATLFACASPAEMQNMVVQDTSLTAPATSPLAGNLMISEVRGGEATNPLWTSEVDNESFRGALQQSLLSTGYLSADPAKATFSVEAELSDLDQPLFGLDLTVRSLIRYRIKNQSTIDIWFDEPVVVSYTATFGDAVIAIKRLRLANEGSIRSNIESFLRKITKITKKP
tara:strand:- start:2461 stop:3021 length:561 start_codon:yes stop_codon:yes gene_type:complete